MTDLSPYLNHTETLNATAQQIIKDLAMSGLEIKFSGNANNAYNELFSQVHQCIEKLLSGNTEKIYNLLYRIDISETQIKKAFLRVKDKSFSETITDLILKRELLKVITRFGIKKL